MDDFNVSALHESKNEWGSRLVTILTPLIIDGYKSILEESIKLCKENSEADKYLMTFQNLISRIPKWNAQIIETERKRIIDKSGCTYLEDLITCVHIIQLKILTAMRVGQKQKKIDINVPKIDEFIHKAYINVARKVYKNVYLFEINIPPLLVQKNYRELEIIVQESILNTLRESIPVEAILKAYMDETVEEDVTEEVNEQIIEQPIKKEMENAGNINAGNINAGNINSVNGQAGNRLSFNNIDYVRTDDGSITNVNAPKTIERLQEISAMRNQQRKMDEEDDDDSGGRLNISSESFTLDNIDVHNIEEPKLDLLPDLLIDEIEVLE
jgi:GTP:adenosylcobinamide-phosphate guanylyltransferase